MPYISRRPKLSITQEELDYLTRLSRSRDQAASIVERPKIIFLSKVFYPEIISLTQDY
jgi:hypothetical protein